MTLDNGRLSPAAGNLPESVLGKRIPSSEIIPGLILCDPEEGAHVSREGIHRSPTESEAGVKVFALWYGQIS